MENEIANSTQTDFSVSDQEAHVATDLVNNDSIRDSRQNQVTHNATSLVTQIADKKQQVLIAPEDHPNPSLEQSIELKDEEM